MIRCQSVFSLVLLLLVAPSFTKKISAQTLSLQHTMVRSSDAPQAAFEGHVVKTNQFYRVTSKQYFDLNGLRNVGLVEVYDARSNTHLLTIHNPAPEEDDYFGFSFDISGHRLVVGSWRVDDATHDDFAYVYDLRSATPEIPTHNLTEATMLSTHARGMRVAIDGDLVATGIPRRYRVFVYDLSSSQPTEPIINIASPGSYSSYGTAVALSGNKLAVGAAYDAGFVYDLDSANPDEPIVTFEPPLGRSNYFGYSIDIDGDVVVMGDHYIWEGYGQVFVYRLDSPNPSEPILTLEHPTLPMYSYFGFSYAVSQERIIVANDAAVAAGEAFLYDLNSDTPAVPVVHFTDPANIVGYTDIFGYSVDIDANQIIIGSPLDTLTDNFGAGYIYIANADNPATPIGKVFNPTPNSSEDEFGNELALSDTHLAVSTRARIHQVVEVYRRDALGSAPEFVIEEPIQGSFGHKMDMDGRWLVVSALFADLGNIENVGAAFVYDLESSSPTVPVYELRDPTPDPYDYFGSDVAIDGNLIAVGCYHEGDQRNGAVYIFDLSSADPEVVASTIDNPGAVNDNSSFGRSVAIENGILVVGAAYQNNSEGAALIYDLNVDLQNPPKTTLPNPEILGSFEFTEFGRDVSISGNWIAVSADSHHGVPGNAWRAGAAYAFDIEGVDFASTATLQPTHRIYNPSPQESELFGRSISVSNGILAVGTWLEETVVEDGGAVYLYNLESNTATIPTHFEPVPNRRDDWFGWRVLIDSNFLAVGAPLADDRAADSGAVYVYEITDLNEVTLDSIDVISGVVQSGGVAELQASDNVDFSLTRDIAQIQAVIEFDVNGHSSNPSPSELKFTLEASVFARDAVSQTIEMFDFANNRFEQMNVQNASRFIDRTVEIVVSENASRFISPSNGNVKSRIRFQAVTNRLRYAANVDHVGWEVE